MDDFGSVYSSLRPMPVEDFDELLLEKKGEPFIPKDIREQVMHLEKWEKIRKHIYVSGRVQGVGFRYRTLYLARGLGLTGWVRNLDDGRVEMELQGTEEEMNRLFRLLMQDSFIIIDDCQTERISVVEEKGFRIRG